MEVFNPLDMENLAASIVAKITGMDPLPLKELERFNGVGIYALYYRGDFPAYGYFSRTVDPADWEPIYIGKASPPGGRRGLTTVVNSPALFKRLSDHAKSINSAINLDIADFYVRWLVMEEFWIPLGESAMIRRHRPLWNTLLDGFGNHAPGGGRKKGAKTRWDTVHPGRPWADEHPPNTFTSSQLEEEMLRYLDAGI